MGRRKVQIDTEQLFAIGKLQCTQEEAAAALGIHPTTLHKAMTRDPALRETWERARAYGLYSLRRLEFKHAQGSGSSAVTMTIHLAKHHLGETERVLNEISGPGGGPIALSALSGAEIEKRIASELDSLAARYRALPSPEENSADSGADDRAPVEVERLEGETESTGA